MASNWYRRLFPTGLSSLKQSVQEFVTTRQGYRLATSIGTVLTGRGTDLMIIDDPLKPKEALSEAQRRKASVVLIENKESGTQLLDEMRREGFHAATAANTAIRQIRPHSFWTGSSKRRTSPVRWPMSAVSWR